MVKLMTKKEVNALANFAIIAQAKKNGLKVYRDDLYINYAEIDRGMTDIEDRAVEMAAKRMMPIARKWMEQIRSKDDLKREQLTLAAPVSLILINFIGEIWSYGQETADKDLETMGIDENWELREFASGQQSAWNNLEGLNQDAYEWYDLYSRKLSANMEAAAFQYMQPKILEHIENGTTGKKLADALAQDFARYGVVRTEIIARTESTKAFNWGRRYRFDGSEALAGYRYSAIMDERTTPICRGLHGSSWTKGDSDLDAYTPPNHFRCRSILVPINKYADFTFSPPDSGWDVDLSDKERQMLSKFMDSAWYPKIDIVKSKITPADLPAPAAPPPSQTDQTAAGKGGKGVDPAAKAQTVEEMIDFSRESSVKDIREFVDHNIGRGLSPSHPLLQKASKLADELESAKKYQGVMVSAEYGGGKTGYRIVKYEQRGDVFVAVKTKWKNAAERDRVLSEIDRISTDPLFVGTKIQIKRSKTLAGSYNGHTDIMVYTPEASQYLKRTSYGGDLGTLYHEIGHRVHVTQQLSKGSGYLERLQGANISIDDDTWDAFKAAVEPHWISKRSRVGDEQLPRDVASRFEYPINANWHYKNGTKDNFYKEMFAEGSSVYLEGIPSEIEKVRKAYPDLLPALERIYRRGVIDDV